MKREGYQVDYPDSVDELRDRIVVGNAARFGADANVHARISANDHVRKEKWLRQIEAQWGPAPGKVLSDGRSIFVFFITLMLDVLGFGLLIPVLPGLVTEFNGGQVAAGSHSYGLLVGVFALLQFIGAPILGALSDRVGRRKIILIALAGASIDYVIMANAPNMTWLFIGRMISGFTAGVFV